jgi:hypothetical protein
MTRLGVITVVAHLRLIAVVARHGLVRQPWTGRPV